MAKRMFSLFFLLALLAALSFPALAEAEPPAVAVNPAAPSITGTLNKTSLSTSFTVIPIAKNLKKITLRFDGPLSETSGQAVFQTTLQPAQFTFTPNLIDAPVQGLGVPVTLKVDGITESGTWEGSFTVEWQGEVTQSISIPVTVTVQAVPTLALETAQSLLIQGLQGDPHPIERTFTLSETSGLAAVTGITLSPGEIRSTDQTRQVPFDAVTGRMLTADRITRDTSSTASLSFKLDSLPSGAYAGKVAVRSANAEPLYLDVSINIKDQPVGAVVSMVLGVAIAAILTWYRSIMMPKDKVRARMEKIRGCLQDADFNEFCGAQKVNGLLTQAEGYLRDDRARDAEGCMDQAQTLWDHWSNNKEKLMETIGQIQALLNQITGDTTGLLERPAAACLQTAMSSVLSQQIPDFAPRPQDLIDRLKVPETGWEALVTHTRGVHQALKTFAGNLEKNNHALQPADLQALTASQQAATAKFNALTPPAAVKDLNNLLDEVAALQKRLEDALKAATSAMLEYQNAVAAARSNLAGVLKAAQNPPIPLLTRTADFILKSILHNAEAALPLKQWPMARQLALNAWDASQACLFLQRSVLDYRKDHSEAEWEPVRQAENNLAAWLTESASYDRPFSEFNQVLYGKVQALRTALLALVSEPVELPWKNQPEAAGSKSPGDTRFMLPMSLEALPPPDLERGEDIAPAAVGEKIPAPKIWEARFWTASRRLLAVETFTFAIGVALLAAYGFKDGYVDDPVFGANGLMDYVKLFVWGFGVEASRAQVVGLVKGWNIVTPGTES